MRAVARRPLPVLAAVGLLALAGAALTLRLEPRAGTDTLVDSDSAAFKATERYRQVFGDDAVIVLVEGDLQRTMLTSDLGRLIGLEGCLSGNVPEERLRELPPVCREIAETKPAKVVYGPGTFVNQAVAEIQKALQARTSEAAKQADEAAEAARKASRERGDPKDEQERLAEQARSLAEQEFFQQALELGLRYGITTLPAIDNPQFVSQLVFDSSRGVGAPKSRFAYLFPSRDAALVQVRLRPDLSTEERERAIALIERAAAAETFQPQRGAEYVVTGVPVVVEALANELQSGMLVLLLAALVVMAATLALVFRTRLRMLPLGLALGAAALAFGAVSLAGGGLTMAAIAALPVLIGLAVDYAIQFQARYDEEREAGERPPEAARAAAVLGGPTIATAGLATIVGFLVLLLSPVPMVRGFGVLLVLGVALAFACVLTAGFAVLVRFGDRRRPEDVPPPLPRTRARAAAAAAWIGRRRAWRLAAPAGRLARRAGGMLADAARGLGDVAADAAAFLGERARRALWSAIERPRRVLAIGLVAALAGWAADTQTDVVSDVRELVPRDLQALEDVNRLQEATGVSGQIDVTVRAADLTDPAVIKWMRDYQEEVLKAHGFEAGSTCAQEENPPELCPALSLPDLFRTTEITGQAVDELLAAVPAYFSQAVISEDRRTATLAFGIRLMPLDRQQAVIEDVERRLDPPEGVTANVAGLPVLAAEANDALSSTWRRALTLLAALAAVFLVLLAVRRRAGQAAVPLIPIAMATGWSALVLFLLRIPLNPMSATLGALVIAISTEFSVLLSARYRQERAAGASREDALDLTYASTGAAVLASGATAIAGFAALVASDIRMLRDFGIVTVVDLTVSLLGVMVVLPAAIVWAEQRGPIRPRDLDPRAWLRALRLWLRDLREHPPALPRPRLPRPALRGLLRRPRLPRASRGHLSARERPRLPLRGRAGRMRLRLPRRPRLLPPLRARLARRR